MTCTSIHQELLFSVTSDLDLAIALELIDTTNEEDLAALAEIENGATKLIDGIAKLRNIWRCDVNTAVHHFMKAGYYADLVAYDSPYWSAAGIVEGIAPEHCNCEGCVNFPCVGVCGLAERVERY